MQTDLSAFQDAIRTGIPATLPPRRDRDPDMQHAPVRSISTLSQAERRLALANALRYFPEDQHGELAPEFADELVRYGRIYMYRFRPDYPVHARPIDHYPAKCRQAAAIMLMIQNNLDPLVAKSRTTSTRWSRSTRTSSLPTGATAPFSRTGRSTCSR